MANILIMLIKQQFSILSVFFIMVHGDSYNYLNPSNNLHPIIDISKSMRSNCQNFPLCRLIRGFNYNPIYNDPHFISSSSSSEYQRRTPKTTAFHPRSYYGYGTNTAPAYYSTFDPISILASLAFLAFLLQSFVSLFDRSRSIIPAIVSSRDSTQEHEIPDPIRLIMRAIDEYDIPDHPFTLSDKKDSQKKLS